MAKDQFSFDIVSELDPQEVRNAVDQAVREVSTRFDFKGTDTSISLDDDLIEMRSSTEDRLKAAREVLREKFVRRELSLKAVSDGPVQPAARGSVRQTLHVNRGISDEKARDLVKLIKKSGVKVASADVEQFFLKNSSGLSGADVEAILMRAKMKSALDNQTALAEADLKEALEDFTPSSYPTEIELQTLMAVLECTSRSLLPEQYRKMERGEIIRRTNELASLSRV